MSADTTTSWSVRLPIALCSLVALITLAACGGGDKKTTTTTAVSPLTTNRPVDTSFTGVGSAAFCDLAKTLNPDLSALGSGASTAQVRSTLEAADKAAKQAVDAAPGEIKGDVTIIVDGLSGVIAAIASANYDFSKVPPEAFAKVQAPEFSYSSARLQAYTTNVCKIAK